MRPEALSTSWPSANRRKPGAQHTHQQSNETWVWTWLKGGSKALPRPGTKVRPAIELAPTVEIEQYEPLANEFFEKILAMNYNECLVTDESSLWDFHSEETNEEYHRKIMEVYGTDVSDIESGNLVRIFERIRAQGQPA
jgi:hypothetical protein